MRFLTPYRLNAQEIAEIEREEEFKRFLVRSPEAFQAMADRITQLEQYVKQMGNMVAQLSQRVKELEAENSLLSAKAKPVEEHKIPNSSFFWTFEDNKLTIYGRGKMPDWNWNNRMQRPWHDDTKSIQEVVISEGITSIGGNAFVECYALTSVKLPERLLNIGWNAFYRCSLLTSVVLPEELQEIGEIAFGSCSKLRTVRLPESLRKIGMGAFSSCYTLAEVEYAGSLETWKEIQIYSGNDELLNAKLHCKK